MPTIFLPSRMPSLNELLDGKAQHGSWNRYNATKAKWASDIGLVVRARGLSAQGPTYLSVLWLEPNTRRDPDNILSGGFKLLLDSLVKAGVMDGDGWNDVLGLAGFWHKVPEKVGCLVYFSPSGLVTKDTMMLLLQQEMSGNGNSNRQEVGNGTRNRSHAGHRAHAQEASVRSSQPGSSLGVVPTVARRG